MKLWWIEAAGSVLAAAALTGCSGGSTMIAPQNTMSVAAGLHGTVHGGQQPVTGASIYLFAAGARGYGSGSASLLNSSVTTDNPAGGGQDGSGNWYAKTAGDGSFVITNAWSCPASPAPSYLYILAVGGNPGQGSGQTNANLALMAALGPCSGVTSSTTVNVNEVTTVASVWALSPFMTVVTNSVPATGVNIGATSTNQTGLAIAFAAVYDKVVNIATGTAPSLLLPANATVPVAKINTLANVLASCVNSTGGTAGDGSTCGTLFGATTVNRVAPTTTIAAALNMAQQPGTNVHTLYQLQPGVGAPFAGLSTQPNDFTIAINYTGGGLHAPSAIASDQSGNVWVVNSGSDAVTLFSNAGSSQLGTSGAVLGGVPAGIAIDLGGNAWVTASNNDVYGLSASTGSMLGAPLTGFNAPAGIAIDPTNELWIVNSGSGTISAVNSTGTSLPGSPFSGAGISSPGAIAINGNANTN